MWDLFVSLAHEWLGLESAIIFGQRERDAARRQTEQTLWIFIFFRWKAVVFMCSCKTEKILGSGAGIIYYLQKMYTVRAYNRNLFQQNHFFQQTCRLACGTCCAEEIEAWLWFHIWHSWVNRELWPLFIVFRAGGSRGDAALQNGSWFCRGWEATGGVSSAVPHFNSSALRGSFGCGSSKVKCQEEVENFVLLNHIKSINLLKPT